MIAVLRSVRMRRRSMPTFFAFWKAELPETWSKSTVTVLTVGATTKVGEATGVVPTNTVVWLAFGGVSLKRVGSATSVPVTSFGGLRVGCENLAATETS